MQTAEFDAKFDRGEHMSEHLDLSTVEHFAEGKRDRLDLTQTKVIADSPKWMAESLDQAADRLGVPGRSLIKLWPAKRLEKAGLEARCQRSIGCRWTRKHCTNGKSVSCHNGVRYELELRDDN